LSPVPEGPLARCGDLLRQIKSARAEIEAKGVALLPLLVGRQHIIRSMITNSSGADFSPAAPLYERRGSSRWGRTMDEREGQDAASFEQRASVYSRRAKSAEDRTTKQLYREMAAHCRELANVARANAAPIKREYISVAESARSTR